ncbi:urokinase plasminogen activator surface receptor-like [Gymnodraco acuticeps]|uniref:Urokinase plasminogen activator surface receptor-like n=1 Tax=Gymnodraco acuticeps TaxID=8218 RepID=A0A6P8U505_GYMAC|nr:urokinase plasminogen activator surface receptor-like [Gymnodraco acuticeps]
MSKLLWSCAALFTLLVTVEALSCYTCNLNILGSCLIEKTVNCTKAQDRCFVAVAKFSADLLDIHERGCIERSKCSNSSSGSILNVKYTITETCCSNNLCNAAAAPPAAPHCRSGCCSGGSVESVGPLKTTVAGRKHVGALFLVL